MRQRELADIKEQQRRLAADQRAAAAASGGRADSRGWDSASLSELMKAVLGE